MTKKETILTICLGVVLAIGLVLLWDKDMENKTLKSKLKLSQENELKLLNEYLKQHNQTLPESIKQYVIRLKEQYKGIDERVVKELEEIENFINTGKDEQALQGLSKIVENLLKEKYKQESFSEPEKKKTPTFHKLLEYAKEQHWISEDSFVFCSELKSIRNTLTHELAIKLDDDTKTRMFFGSIGVIYELKGIPND